MIKVSGTCSASKDKNVTYERASQVVDVLGTATLSILCGHWRYAHINSVRGDTLNPPLLGMTRAVSEDVVRRAMKRIDHR